MPIIKTVTPEEAQGKVKEAYDVFAGIGMVPAPMQMYSVSPDLAAIKGQVIGYFRGQSRLSPGLLALIRMLVAEELKYYYCISLNTKVLAAVGILDEDAAAKVIADPESAPLAEADKALLMFVLKAVKTPEEVSAEDMARLKELGWSEREVFEATVQGTNMVADGILFKAFKMDEAPAC
ncbi:MAG: hypothetical protein KQH53_14325 [Desulfarculaceae bacterium]|nr:hypothetical protein [Desulfarculaceae bacterium]